MGLKIMSEDNETIEDTDTEMSVDDVRQDAIRTMMSQTFRCSRYIFKYDECTSR